MLECSPHLLLVGQQLGNFAVWMRRLEAHGCLWEFVESSDAARRSLDRTPFEVVLVDSRLPNGSAYDLIRAVLDARSSLFFWVPLKHSGRWLPIVLQGSHQLEADSISTRHFFRMLAGLLHVAGLDARPSRPSSAQKLARPGIDHGRPLHHRSASVAPRRGTAAGTPALRENSLVASIARRTPVRRRTSSGLAWPPPPQTAFSTHPFDADPLASR